MPEGRELIHKNLNIDTKTMLWLMRNPVQGRSIEYADNRISLYAAQHGKCAVTGSIMEAHDIHCHHKRPAAKGGTDEYGNLVLISAPVHKLIHASDMATIKFYLNLLNLDSTQILKLNKFREMAEMPLIDTSLAPIPFATMSNREWGHVGTNYFRGLFALAFQAFLMMVCVAIYAALISSVRISSNMHSALIGVAAYTVILCFSLMKTGSLSKQIFGSH